VEENVDDITATSSDDLYASLRVLGWKAQIKVVKIINHGQPCCPPELLILGETLKADSESRVDVSDSWVVVAAGSTWELYMIKPKPRDFNRL
jgi:hypothetical protein